MCDSPGEPTGRLCQAWIIPAQRVGSLQGLGFIVSLLLLVGQAVYNSSCSFIPCCGVELYMAFIWGEAV